MTEGELRERARLVLTAKQFEAWELHRFRNCSYGLIAYMLDIDKGTVRDRIKRAEQILDRWERDNQNDGNLRSAAI